MKHILKNTTYILALLLLLAGCNQPSTEIPKVTIDHESNYQIIADTIITDVVIKNPDDDEWTEYCLRNLNKEQFIDELFRLVYNGELKPRNFFTEEPMTIDEVKEIEQNEDYRRENIGKVQFEEAWYFDPVKKQMIKKIHSIMVAYELFDSNGDIKGYKPVFKVYFNE